jgi:hypothetical protein
MILDTFILESEDGEEMYYVDSNTKISKNEIVLCKTYLILIFGVIPKKMVLYTNRSERSIEVQLTSIGSLEIFEFYIPSYKKPIKNPFFDDSVDDYLSTIWKKLEGEGCTRSVHILVDKDKT